MKVGPGILLCSKYVLQHLAVRVGKEGRDIKFEMRWVFFRFHVGGVWQHFTCVICYVFCLSKQKFTFVSIFIFKICNLFLIEDLPNSTEVPTKAGFTSSTSIPTELLFPE